MADVRELTRTTLSKSKSDILLKKLSEGKYLGISKEIAIEILQSREVEIPSELLGDSKPTEKKAAPKAKKKAAPKTEEKTEPEEKAAPEEKEEKTEDAPEKKDKKVKKGKKKDPSTEDAPKEKKEKAAPKSKSTFDQSSENEDIKAGTEVTFTQRVTEEKITGTVKSIYTWTTKKGVEKEAANIAVKLKDGSTKKYVKNVSALTVA